MDDTFDTLIPTLSILVPGRRERRATSEVFLEGENTLSAPCEEVEKWSSQLDHMGSVVFWADLPETDNVQIQS